MSGFYVRSLAGLVNFITKLAKNLSMGGGIVCAVHHRAIVGAGSAPPQKPAKHHQGLVVSREQPRFEAVAPLDLAEERLAVLRIADRARRDREPSFRAERIRGPPKVSEDVPHTRNRGGQEAPSPAEMSICQFSFGMQATPASTVTDVVPSSTSGNWTPVSTNHDIRGDDA